MGKLNPRRRKAVVTAVLFAGLIPFFQNCSKIAVADQQANGLNNALEVCEGVSCTLDPLTEKSAVTTILLALGDEANAQLVVNRNSAQLIAETVIRYTSPKANPKVLVVYDKASVEEQAEDMVYVRDVLLKRYDVSTLNEPAEGIADSDLVGYDVVWYNNPGRPMSSRATKGALIRFKGGVVLQGDDLSWGVDDAGFFTTEELTGLLYKDNGTSVQCAGKSYGHDNNGGEQYRVTLNPEKIPGADASTIHFRYGNDIDNTRVARSDLEVLATAKGGPEVCSEDRPTIVRYQK